jgi:hypothetical protein
MLGRRDEERANFNVAQILEDAIPALATGVLLLGRPLRRRSMDRLAQLLRRRRRERELRPRAELEAPAQVLRRMLLAELYLLVRMAGGFVL